MASVKVEGKYLRSTSYEVTYPTLANQKHQPRRVDLFQKKGSHDVLTLEYSQVSNQWVNNLKSGVPIKLSWKQGTQSKHFVGYVQGVRRTVSPQKDNAMVVTCWGSTFHLKERSTRVFTNSTITDAVRKIVTEHGFKFIGDEHSYRFPQLAMAGHSYWEWIQEQAAKIGYGAYADGMDFYFKKLDKLIDQSFSNTPVLSMFSADIPSGAHVLDRTLQSFNVLHSEHVESSKDLRAIKTVGGVDPLTGKMFVSTVSPVDAGTALRGNTNDVIFTQHMTDRVAPDAGASEVLAEGAAALARFNMPATAKAQGDPRLRPYGTVYIQGTGDSTDGYWVVNEVRHMMHLVGDYEAEIKLSTDGTGAATETAFRKRSPGGLGTVDLNHALNNGGKIVNNFAPSSVILNSPSPIVNQGNQGARRTPTVWTSSRKGA